MLVLAVGGVCAAAAMQPDTLRGERGERTRLVWSMTGENAFVSELFGLFVDMDPTLGADFERGLEQLERAATSG